MEEKQRTNGWKDKNTRHVNMLVVHLRNLSTFLRKITIFCILGGSKKGVSGSRRIVLDPKTKVRPKNPKFPKCYLSTFVRKRQYYCCEFWVKIEVFYYIFLGVRVKSGFGGIKIRFFALEWSYLLLWRSPKNILLSCKEARRQNY